MFLACNILVTIFWTSAKRRIYTSVIRKFVPFACNSGTFLFNIIARAKDTSHVDIVYPWRHCDEGGIVCKNRRTGDLEKMYRLNDKLGSLYKTIARLNCDIEKWYWEDVVALLIPPRPSLAPKKMNQFNSECNIMASMLSMLHTCACAFPELLCCIET